MLIYDFIERRFDDIDYFMRMAMVDTLLDRNVSKFGQEDPLVEDICLTLWQEEQDELE